MNANRVVFFVALITPIMAYADPPPALLQITIERVRADGERRYGQLEERMAETCARLDCPNAYLALESVAGPKEVWWLVEYSDDAERERVASAYAANPALLTALAELAASKRDVADAPIEHMTRFRGDVGAATQWRVGLEPFVVIATRAAPGAVFESAEHALFTVVTAESSADAEQVAAQLGSSAHVLRVQPSWSRPKDVWSAANPRLWGSR